ncbi:AT-hook motif nuclear-localized protein 13-like [Lycium ferocissimum]|uniref:AT-hook motif nuclear-localized protein 13-like n=1 Tax=Lycium ferocissimum TaxID=112874 RepID=UPI00281511D8|nr:AT-hook motif nuclear-localized protein 13-like [Lycium ferocissimum]
MDSQESQAGHHQNQHHHQPQHPQLHSLPHHPHPHQHTPPHVHPMMMPRPQHHHQHHQHPQHQHQQHQQQQQQQHQQQQPNSYVVPNNVVPTHNNNNSTMMQQIQHQQQQQNSGFPFNSMVNTAPPPAQPQPQNQPNLDYSDASSPRATGFNIEPARKKRGRPRKYSPDGNIALGLSPTPVTPISSSIVPHTDSGSGGGDVEGASSENPSKKARGRPPGSGKRQLDALGAAGVGFTPHVITVNVGEDIASKIMAFAQQGPRTVCILSANGAICNVTLRQPAMGGGTVSYEGRFEIISLTGSFLRSESNGSSGPNGLSVSLAGSDGRVLGGGVAGMLMAATPVQVIVGSFIAEGKKPKSKAPPSTPPPSNMLNFGAPATDESPPSQGDDASNDSSDENGDGPFHHEQGPYGNAGQPMHGMSMYANMGWPKSL